MARRASISDGDAEDRLARQPGSAAEAARIRSTGTHSSQGRPSRRILICGAVYARNLGDGVIADCMAHALRELAPDAEVSFVDLSGRGGFDAPPLKGKVELLEFLRRCPRIVRDAVAISGLLWLSGSRLRPAWRELFGRDDVAIVGGGHLFSDYHLNFPAKLALLAHYARKAGAVVAVHAVGVSRHWSRLGRILLDRVARSVSAISVRDEASARFLAAHLPGLARPVRIAVDPGYLAATVYREVAVAGGGVGVNVADTAELFSTGARGNRPAKQDSFWLGLIRHYAASGRPVILFTNGADEDEAYLRHLLGLLDEGVRHSIAVAPRPANPAELAGIVKGLELLIAHRLHANILAFAHGIPFVALGWDEKLEAQLELMDRLAFLVPAEQLDSERVVALADAAERSPISAAKRAELAGRVRADIAGMLNELAATDALGGSVARRAEARA